jgi:hypothetical protein
MQRSHIRVGLEGEKQCYRELLYVSAFQCCCMGVGEAVARQFRLLASTLMCMHACGGVHACARACMRMCVWMCEVEMAAWGGVHAGARACICMFA